MEKDRYIMRRMTAEEARLAVDWAAKEGWIPGLDDASIFHETDPDGFFVGLLDGDPIASVSMVSYGGSFGFVGLYIVRPEFRRRGYGFRLWKTAAEHVSGLNVGLDAVLEQQKVYERSGYRFCYLNMRYKGTGTGSGRKGPGVIELSRVPTAEVLAYDDRLFPAPRHNFVERWIAQPGSTALGTSTDGKLSGYAVLRPCGNNFFKIGPLFADDPALAEQLFDAMISHAPEGSSVFFDIPEPNSAACDIVRKNRMEKVFETARMYTQSPPDIPIEKVFGVTTFELG